MKIIKLKTMQGYLLIPKNNGGSYDYCCQSSLIVTEAIWGPGKILKGIKQ